jgi:two-component system response regulator HydG
MYPFEHEHMSDPLQPIRRPGDPPGLDGAGGSGPRGAGVREPAVNQRVLVVDDDADLRQLFEVALAQKGFRVTLADSGDAALSALAAEPIDAVVTDLQMRGMDGIELARRVAEGWPHLPLLVVTAYGSIPSAVGAMRAGAYDFLTKPVDFDALQLSLRRGIEHMSLRREVQRLRQSLAHAQRYDELVGESAEMSALYDMIGRIAGVHSSVLVTGETGTGKGLVARVLHRQSPRAAGPFVVVNCAALPATLLESELFGHERGAFTDAKGKRTGLFVEASGGTLFLDEVGTLPLDLQPKLLRALEDRVVRPLGSNQEVPVDVRVVAATNIGLEAAAAEGRFREDLFFRLNVIQLSLPPLRERDGDVLLLAHRFIDQLAPRFGKTVSGMTEAVAEKMMTYPWPGNVRELHNCIERAVALTRYDRLAVDDLPDRMRAHQTTGLVEELERAEAWLSIDEVEQKYILRVLEALDGNRSETARILGVDRRTLYRKLVRYGVRSSDGQQD